MGIEKQHQSSHCSTRDERDEWLSVLSAYILCSLVAVLIFSFLPFFSLISFKELCQSHEKKKTVMLIVIAFCSGEKKIHVEFLRNQNKCWFNDV